MNNQIFNPYANNANTYTFTGNNQPQQNDTISVISISGGENSALNYLILRKKCQITRRIL